MSSARPMAAGSDAPSPETKTRSGDSAGLEKRAGASTSSRRPTVPSSGMASSDGKSVTRPPPFGQWEMDYRAAADRTPALEPVKERAPHFGGALSSPKP